MFPLFKGKSYGSITVGERGQIVIPASLRKEFGIKPGDQMMVFAKPEKKIKAIAIISTKELSSLLEKAEKAIAKLETKVSKK